MKLKATRKQITRNYAKIFQAGYCETRVFRFEPVAFNSGVYGWNYDVYDLGDITITEGYRGMFGRKLPDTAKRIIKNAEKYLQARHGYQAEEKYMKISKRKFIKALQEA